MGCCLSTDSDKKRVGDSSTLKDNQPKKEVAPIDLQTHPEAAGAHLKIENEVVELPKGEASITEKTTPTNATTTDGAPTELGVVPSGTGPSVEESQQPTGPRSKFAGQLLARAGSKGSLLDRRPSHSSKLERRDSRVHAEAAAAAAAAFAATVGATSGASGEGGGDLKPSNERRPSHSRKMSVSQRRPSVSVSREPELPTGETTGSSSPQQDAPAAAPTLSPDRPSHGRRPSVSLSANERQARVRQGSFSGAPGEMPTGPRTPILIGQNSGNKEAKKDKPLAQQVLKRNALDAVVSTEQAASTTSASTPGSPNPDDKDGGSGGAPASATTEQKPSFGERERRPSISEHQRRPSISLDRRPSHDRRPSISVNEYQPPAFGQAHGRDSPLFGSGSRPGTPGGTNHALEVRSDAIWLHYAGRDGKVLGKKQLIQLSEDIFDEFQQRYRNKLSQMRDKQGELFTEEKVERDLQTDLPYLLPAPASGGAKYPSRDDYIRYIYKRCLIEMSKGTSSSSANDDGKPKITKIEFLTGWRQCSELLFSAIERTRDAVDAKQSPCHLM